MTWTMRMEAGGVLGLVLAGLAAGAAAAVGIVHVEPPAMIAPAIAFLVAMLATLKTALMLGAVLSYLVRRA
jgi:hypothetical protein